MVNRTGTLDSPTGVISITPISPAHADTSNVYEALGAAATRINQQLQPAREQLAVTQAQGDFQAGREHLRTVLSHEDELYNNAMLQQYLTRSEGDIEQQAAQLESDPTTGTDPAAFDTAWQAAKQAYLANAQPDFEPHLAQLYDRLGVEATTRIAERKRNIAIQGAQQSTEARLQQQEANLSGYSDLNSPGFRAAWQAYEQSGRMLTSNPLNGITAEEWSFRRNHTLGKLQGNVIVAQATQFYESNGANADAAAQAYQMIDQASNNPDLTLTDSDRNAIFADGRRHIALLESERRAREAEARSSMTAARTEARMELGPEFEQAQAQAHNLAVIDDTTMEGIGRLVDTINSPSVNRQYYELRIANDARRTLQGLGALQIQQQLLHWRAEAASGSPDAGDAAVKLQEGLRYTNAISSPSNMVESGAAHFQQTPPETIHVDQTGNVALTDFRPRIAWVETHASQLGIQSPEYFSSQESAVLREYVRQGGPAALGVAMRVVQSANAAGGNRAQRYQRAESMMRQIAPGREAEPFMAIGRALLRGVSTPVALSMANGVALRGVPNAAVHPPPNLAANERDNEMQATLGTLYPVYAHNMADTLGQIQTGADLLWEQNARAHPHDTDNTGSFRGTYQVAIQEALGANHRVVGGQTIVFGGVGRVNGGETVLPVWLARTTAESTFRSLTREDFVTAAGSVPTTGDLNRWHDARLIPIGDGQPGIYYLATADGAYYKTRASNNAEGLYILDLNRLRPRLAQRPEIATPP